MGYCCVRNVRSLAHETPGQDVVRPLDNPIKTSGGLVILHGSLAPEGCVVKVAGYERQSHTGRARVFDSEEAAMAAVTGRKIEAGDFDPARRSSIWARIRA